MEWVKTGGGIKVGSCVFGEARVLFVGKGMRGLLRCLLQLVTRGSFREMFQNDDGDETSRVVSRYCNYTLPASISPPAIHRTSTRKVLMKRVASWDNQDSDSIMSISV